VAIRIDFDSAHNAISPTFVLAKRYGDRIGVIPATNIVCKDTMNSYSEISFQVDKVDTNMWDDIKDFQIMWCKEWNLWFEIYVTINETNSLIKYVTAKSLGEAELSQVKLYGVEINSDDDIARDDYVDPTVFYNNSNHRVSLLHRLTTKVPHYNIKHVDMSLALKEYTFSFDDVSIYDAFKQISEKVNCLFVIEVETNSSNQIERNISVYDLEGYCLNCGYRGEFIDVCPECGSTNVLNGYGDDTSIFVSAENLTNEIKYSTNVDSVKNCFRLVAGDDLMTATVASCNPSGGYMWFISDEMKETMSDALRSALVSYNDTFDYYQSEYEPSFPDARNVNTISYTLPVNSWSGGAQIVDIHTSYAITKDTRIFVSVNAATQTQLESDGCDKIYVTNEDGVLVAHYSGNSPSVDITVQLTVKELINLYNDLLTTYGRSTSVINNIQGYSQLMNIYYDTIDLYLYLSSGMMPSVETETTTAQIQTENIYTAMNNSNVAVQKLSTASTSTVNSTVLNYAKILIDYHYQIKVDTEHSSYNSTTHKWTGKFIITNYSNEEDTYTSANNVVINVNDDYQTYINQIIDKAFYKKRDDVDISTIFAISNETSFKNTLKQYCLARLNSFHGACQSVLDILIEQCGTLGWKNASAELQSTYNNYYQKLIWVDEEIKLRESEIEILIGKRNNDILIADGFQAKIQAKIYEIQQALDLETYLGSTLWREFVSFRREDTYTNDNYVSDGLDNAELFEKAEEYLKDAKIEIFKSATLQHQISATLKNLLVIPAFSTIVDNFEIGNWLRLRVDDKVYRLRLIEYTIDYSDLSNLSITFSDVAKTLNGYSDLKSILSQASSMATSYNAVSKQAAKGSRSKELLDNWVERGLSVTTTNIINVADEQEQTWDEHGMLFRKYDTINDKYEDTQLKIINSTLAVTDNNWRTSKAAIGKFNFFNPQNGELEEAYGVIADTLVGNLILSEDVGIYNSENSITLNKNGLIITVDETFEDNVKTALLVQKKELDGNEEEQFTKLFCINSEGEFYLNGSVKINTPVEGEEGNGLTLDELADPDRVTGKVNEIIDSVLNSDDESIIVFVTDADGNMQFDPNTGEPLTQERTVSGLYSKIDAQYSNSVAYTQYMLNKYKTEVSQYMTFDSDRGLILGSTENSFFTQVTNEELAFFNGNTKVAYMSGIQLYIDNAVINKTMQLGQFFFSPRNDGGISITWQGD